MAREAKPKIEDVAKVIKNVDLSALSSSRYTGNSIVQIEHCLIKVLAEISKDHEFFKYRVDELDRNCHETTNYTSFLKAFNELTEEKRQNRRNFTNFRLVGNYFDALLEKFILAEEKLLEIGKPNTLKHSRILAELINKKLAMCAIDMKQQNNYVEALRNLYFPKNESSKISKEQQWLNTKSN